MVTLSVHRPAARRSSSPAPEWAKGRRGGFEPRSSGPRATCGPPSPPASCARTTSAARTSPPLSGSARFSEPPTPASFTTTKTMETMIMTTRMAAWNKRLTAGGVGLNDWQWGGWLWMLARWTACDICWLECWWDLLGSWWGSPECCCGPLECLVRFLRMLLRSTRMFGDVHHRMLLRSAGMFGEVHQNAGDVH